MSKTLDFRLNAYRRDIAAKHLQGRVEADAYVVAKRHQVRAPAAPVMNAPGPGATMVSEALFGERMDVYDTKDGLAWGQLCRDGYVGYVPQSALSMAVVEPTHKVCALRTYIFPAPDIKRPALALISMEAEVAVDRVEGEFAVTRNGEYLIAGHLSENGDGAVDFVAVAEQFVGTPYLWGGRQSLGIDCSGLVQIALLRSMRDCPRDSDMQETALGEPLGAPPDLDELKRGDIVFWSGHVGIMVDQTRLLHANAYHMTTQIEPLHEAMARIAKTHNEITAVKRLPDYSLNLP